jgi:flagellar biosynthetic protein FliQ
MLGEGELLDVMRIGLYTSFMISLPILAGALVVGLVIGLFQALTSIQELTLTFVPKLGAIIVIYWLSMSFMTRSMVALFQDHIIPRIQGF